MENMQIYSNFGFVLKGHEAINWISDAIINLIYI